MSVPTQPNIYEVVIYGAKVRQRPGSVRVRHHAEYRGVVMVAVDADPEDGIARLDSHQARRLAQALLAAADLAERKA